jgi:exosortase J
MSAFPDTEIQLQGLRRWGLSSVQYAAVATALAVLGLSAIWPSVSSLWTLWTTDALKSIGMAIPVVSLFLILRAWNKLGWEAEGTWWGLVILLTAAVVSRLQQEGILILVVSPRWSTVLPPPSLMLLAYGSGVVLLMGGVPLYRAALFPILLLWFANPLPHAFSLLVDLPLQRASAHVARSFAMSMGHSLTPDHLRLMFTPDFGMFIAPGCNGIRGSVTMGFIALIAGYVYRFRWYANALVTTGAVLLGYVFNLGRLCLLVLYYMVALHFPSLQEKAENADYVIGAALFLVATLLLFEVIRLLNNSKGSNQVEAPLASPINGLEALTPGFRYTRLLTMGVVVLLGFAGMVRAYALTPLSSAVPDALVERFPMRLGNYSKVRSWNETVLGGEVLYVWAQYAPADGGRPITIGASPVFGWHDPLICHSVRGEDPLWQGQLTVATADAVPVTFSSALYNDGVRQYVEASTICSGAGCGEFATERTHFGFVYTRVDPKSLLAGQLGRPIPVVLRAETIDITLPTATARQQLIQDLRTFLSSVKLGDLTHQ